MPVVLEQADHRRQGPGIHQLVGIQMLQRLRVHPCPDRAAFEVELIQAVGKLQRLLTGFGHQAANAHPHVLQAPRGIQSRSDLVGQAAGGDGVVRDLRHLAQCDDARPAAAGANACQTLFDQNAIASIELDHVGHGADGRQIEVAGDLPGHSQPLAQRRHEIESHSDAGQALAAKGIPVKVRVDDGVCARQFGARQVMIGDQHIHAGVPGRLGPGDAGDTVVNGDDESWRPVPDLFHRLRRQAVTEFETVGNEHIHGLEAEVGQAQAQERGAGRAVGVEIPRDHHAPLSMAQQQIDASLHLVELAHRAQIPESEIKLPG